MQIGWKIFLQIAKTKGRFMGWRKLLLAGMP